MSEVFSITPSEPLKVNITSKQDTIIFQTQTGQIITTQD